jgi:hypothetical protein
MRGEKESDKEREIGRKGEDGERKTGTDKQSDKQTDHFMY